MKKIIAYLRKEIITGKHLYNCMADASLRAAGWKRIHDAARVARRLNIDLRTLPTL